MSGTRKKDKRGLKRFEPSATNPTTEDDKKPDGDEAFETKTKSPSVPSDTSLLKEIGAFFESYLTLITFIIIVASGVSTFIVFQNDLAEAESNIDKNEVNIKENNNKIIAIEKDAAVELNERENISKSIDTLKEDDSKLDNRLRDIEVKHASHIHK